MYSYVIDENNLVKIFKEGINEPVITQPYYPNKDSFDSEEEARIWAESAIAYRTDPTAPFPIMGKDIPQNPRNLKE